MRTGSLNIFLDTSVVFAAVLSKTGGARKLFFLGEAELLRLMVGPSVLRECEDVVRRKAPGSLPTLARLLELGAVEVTGQPAMEVVNKARTYVAYAADAFVLAEAMAAAPDWFVTHDKAHFLKSGPGIRLGFQIGTPGDLIQSLTGDWRGP